MKNCYHTINDMECPHRLKGASLVSARTVNQQPNKQLIFFSEDISFLVKSLLLCRKFITKYQAQYQNPKDILNELSTSINILSARQNIKSNLKGASQICNKTKIQSL